MENEIKIGEKFISGKIVNLDDEDLERLNHISKALKQIETNLKETIISKF